MISVAKSFTAVGVGNGTYVRHGEQITYNVTGTFVGTVKLVKTTDAGATFTDLVTGITGAANGTLIVESPGLEGAQVLFLCTAFTSGTIETEMTQVSETQQSLLNSSGVSQFDLLEDGVSVPGTLTVIGETALQALLSSTAGVEVAESYSDAGHSHQAIAADLSLGAATVGDSTDPKFLAAIMGNVIGASLTKTKPYLGGVIGMYSITGTKATTYQSGAVLAGIADGVTAVDGAVVAFLDGDSAVTTAGAAFKVRSNNSNAASGFNFGVDLQDAAHDGYQPVDNAFYLKAPIRLVEDICIVANAGVPGVGVGQTTAGPGSICVDYTNGKLYVNGGSKATPDWKLVTSA